MLHGSLDVTPKPFFQSPCRERLEACQAMAALVWMTLILTLFMMVQAVQGSQL